LTAGVGEGICEIAIAKESFKSKTEQDKRENMQLEFIAWNWLG
jgi:hypothetical protein